MRSRPYFADDLDPAGRIGAERVGMQDRDAAQQADICRRDGTEIHVPEAGSKLGLTQGGVLPMTDCGVRHTEKV